MTVNSIAERYLQCITQYQPQGPYYLCGESFGGIIALEVTRKLKQRGQSVALTAMFDTTAPRFLATLTRWQKIKLHVRQAQINKAYALQKIRAKWALRPKSVKMNPSADQLRANARSLASENYHPAPFDDSVLLLIARDRSPFEPFIHDLGWRPYLPNLTSVIVKGDHLSMLQEGNVHDLAAHLESHL